MFGIPATTPYDLRFRMLGIPVRVHPLFWIITALLGGLGRSDTAVRDVAIWVPCAFLSILVHEYGHGLMARALGYQSSIVLYGMGGLCYSEGERQTPWQRLAVLFSGPGAGLLLAGAVFATMFALVARGYPLGEVPSEIMSTLLVINLFWSILNLFPIWPLDGGQITGVVLSMFSRHNGMRWGHIISLVTAGVLALVAYQFYRDWFLIVFFAFFAVTNYQKLQELHQQARYGERDDDWWRR